MTSNNSSNKVALLALLSLIPIFVFVIGNGWAEILDPYLPFGAPVAYLAGALFGLVAVILAWAVASERARLRVETTARFTWIAYLGLLFALSALGTMNWLFKVSEVPTFLTEAAMATEDKLGKLDLLAQKGITLAQTEKLLAGQAEQMTVLDGLIVQMKGQLAAASAQNGNEQKMARDQINALMDAFESEITNPLRAGCGEVARNYIDQIKAKLGDDLNLPSGSCNDAAPEVVVKAYKESIQKAMDRRFGSPSACVNTQPVKDIAAKIEAIIKVPLAALDGECPSSQNVINDTVATVEKYKSALPQVAPSDLELAKLRDESSFSLRKQVDAVKSIYSDARNLEKEIAEPKLKEAWSEYHRVFVELSPVIDAEKFAAAALPDVIVDQRIDKIGSVSNTIEILISRYDHISTYPIVFAGIFFDMILIAFFARVEASRVGRTKNGLIRTPHDIRMDEIRSSRIGRGSEKL